MESPALRIPARPHRKPLQLKNFRVNLHSAGDGVMPQKPNPMISRPTEGNDNFESSNFLENMKHFPSEESLGAEHLRRDMERADATFREMDEGFERWIRYSERKLGDLVAAEMEIWRIVKATERRSSCSQISQRCSPFVSLRVCEVEAAQFQEIGDVAGGMKSESPAGYMKSKFLEIGNVAEGRKSESSAGYMKSKFLEIRSVVGGRKSESSVGSMKNKFQEIGNAAGGMKSESPAGYMKSKLLEIRNVAEGRKSESSAGYMKSKFLEIRSVVGGRKSESFVGSMKNKFQEIGNAAGGRKAESSPGSMKNKCLELRNKN